MRLGVEVVNVVYGIWQNWDRICSFSITLLLPLLPLLLLMKLLNKRNRSGCRFQDQVRLPPPGLLNMERIRVPTGTIQGIGSVPGSLNGCSGP